MPVRGMSAIRTMERLWRSVLPAANGPADLLCEDGEQRTREVASARRPGRSCSSRVRSFARRAPGRDAPDAGCCYVEFPHASGRSRMGECCSSGFGIHSIHSRALVCIRSAAARPCVAPPLQFSRFRTCTERRTQPLPDPPARTRPQQQTGSDNRDHPLRQIAGNHCPRKTRRLTP
jgi:hypothetical protein